MSDLYTVLKQSIVDRGLRSPAARGEVYSQARTAMIRELWSYDPPLAEDEIDQRIGQFDRAVDRIESDLVVTFARKPAPPPRGARKGSPPEKPAPVYEGYDEEADYAPAFGGRAAPPPDDEPEERDEPAERSDEHDDDEMERFRRWHGRRDADPLAARSAAIEDALNSDPDDEYGSDQPDEVEEPRDEREDDYRSEEQRPAPENRRYAPEAEEPREQEYYDEREEDDEPSGRSWRSARDWTGAWAGLSERTRVRLLIGTISSFAVVLVALAGYVFIPLLSSADDPPALVAGPATPGKSSGRVSDAAAAARIPLEPADIAQTFFVFDGSDPTVFESGPGNPVRFDKDRAGGFARVSSSSGDAGVRVVIGPGLASRLAGRPIRVTLTARSARENGAVGLRFAYQSGVAISHWQTANLGASYAALGLIWRLPTLRTNQAGDYLLIEPGIPGDGTAAEIQSIRVDLLKREPA